MAWLRGVAILLMLLVGSVPAAARQVALVIGNDAYRNIEPLRKAVADAAGYARMLEAKGYAVMLKQDLTRDEMGDAVAAFSEEIAAGDTAVFVYSGHGWSDGAQNFLLGVDVPAQGSQEALARRSIPLKNGLDGVVDAMDRKGASLKVAIVDACRDNPFRPAPGQKGYGLGRGLAPVLAPGGTFIVFSAAAGQSALDRLSDGDADPHGVFTRVFLPKLAGDLSLLDAVKATQTQVSALARAVGQEQRPAYYDEVTGSACLSRACLTAGAREPSAPVAPPETTAERRFVLPEGAILSPRSGALSAITAVAFGPDGRTALSGSEDRTVTVWDLASGRVLRRLDAGSEPVFSIALAPDGRTAVSGGDEKTIRVWDVGDGRLLRTLEGHADSVRSLAFAPDGRTVLSGSYDRTLKLWEVSTGRLLRTFAGHADGVRAVVFAPDGRTAASAGYDNTMKLWDVAGGKVLRTFEGHADSVLALALAPDGRLLLSGGEDKILRLWQAEGGAPVRSFEGHTEAVTAVAFAPDGRTALSASRDGTVKLWDVAAGQSIRTFAGQGAEVAAAAFSPNGHRVLSGGADGMRLWNARDGTLLATFLTTGSDWLSVLPGGLFATSGNPEEFLSLASGAEALPMDGFVALNRRETLAILPAPTP